MKIKRLRKILEWSQSPTVPLYSGIPNSTGSVSALPYDAWDNSIHGLKSPLDALSMIIQNVEKNPSLRSLIGGLSKLEEKIEKIIIIRVHYIEENLSLDVQLRVTINGQEYWVIMKDFNKDCKIVSELESIPNMASKKEFLIRLKGILIRILNEWFKPKEGRYKVLKEFVCRDWLGRKYIIHQNSFINVLPNKKIESDSKEIHFSCKEKEFILDGRGYYFFNFWNVKI